MIETAIALGKGTLEVLGLLVSLTADGRSVWNTVTTRSILDALRELYFYDDRTLSILERTINGEDLTSEEVDRAHAGFNLSQKKIDTALENIDFAAQSPHRALSVEAYNKLRGLSRGKSDVRIQIDHFLYELGMPTSSENERTARIEQAKQIRSQIHEINERITIIDNNLRGAD
ncbi:MULTISPECIES: hypothetical protein [unclassified Rhizobium]|uniref:hypothetical protein n=1 Tax=unclassified Rhizobium TaxID=2613769 RepID=UPI000BDA23F3|nr:MULTISPECIES: hypothetical protein [unclassified Rhizobium]MDH7804898.1 hypothetical protein [Rhizobium sp. AN67]MDQ4406517.1 hypothetical protein [Rhizobium sp. AN63]SOD56274.1 hypothetical protein SAMN05216595_2989 [Rhizobium sp. AN6A]